MKKLLLFVALLFSTFTFGQGYDLTATGGSVGTYGGTLSAPLSNVIWITNDTTGLGASATGSATIQTGNILSGDFQNGATFASGGSATITASNNNDAISFSGVVISATWASHKLANGLYFYSLSGQIQDPTGNTGAFVLTTANGSTSGQKFTGSSLITTVYFHLN